MQPAATSAPSFPQFSPGQSRCNPRWVFLSRRAPDELFSRTHRSYQRVSNQAIVFAMGAPAVELFHGDREDADTARNGDTNFDELGHDVGMLAGHGANGNHEGNAVTDSPEPDHGAQNEGNKTESTLHGAAHLKCSAPLPREPYPRRHAFHTPGIQAKSIPRGLPEPPAGVTSRCGEP